MHNEINTFIMSKSLDVDLFTDIFDSLHLSEIFVF